MFNYRYSYEGVDIFRQLAYVTDITSVYERKAPMKKAFLILLVIICLGVAVWNAYLLFTNQTDPLIGWIILAISMGVLCWNISVLRAYRIRTGTVVAVFIIIALIAMTVSAFAGIEPFAEIKDSLVFKVTGLFAVGEDAAAQRTVRATINAFNQGRGDRLADLTTSAVREELMGVYGWGVLLGGVQIVDYDLSILRGSEEWQVGTCEIRVRGGLKTVFGVEVYDEVFFVTNVGDDWIVTNMLSYSDYQRR